MNHQLATGRIVQFLAPGDDEPTPALITKVVDREQQLVHLTLFKPGATNYAWDVPHSTEPKMSHWSWPVRVQ